MLATALLAGLPALAAAQGTCERGRGVIVPDLGFDDVSCTQCTIEYSPGHNHYRFWSEPRLGGIHGSGQGRLREGDRLVAVDGRLITTPQAGERLANIRRGERVRLTVRRGNGTQEVEVVAGQRCLRAPDAPLPPEAPMAPMPPMAPATPRPPAPPRPPAAPAPPAAPRTPRAPGGLMAPMPPMPPLPPTPPTPPVPPTPPEILPEGWFGFGISCDHCGIRGRGREAANYFGESPEVESVEPGSPAALAGIRRGDLLTHVDGVALTSAAGARRFAAIRPGQNVAWTYRRGSRAFSARATAVRRPDLPPARPGSAPTPPAAVSRQLRYSGAVGSSNVEVRGAPVTITRDERTGETVIRSHDLIVRIRPRP
jgi:hypothetical protein